MHTPTKAQMQVVIDNLRQVLPRAMHATALDMQQGAVNKGHECGTTHCFAGWYAIAALPNDMAMNYKEGVKLIDQHLGFNVSDFPYALDCFVGFIIDNSDIWGNHRGADVYTDRMAFYHAVKRSKGAENLQHIIDHLEEVRDRLPA